MYIRECIAYSYVLYQCGETLLMDENRLRKIHEYLYLTPKVQMIYIIRKEDIDNDDLVINMGWAVKISDMQQFHIEENEYTERYHTRKTLMSLEKLPANVTKIKNQDGEHLKKLLHKPFAYMEKHNIKLAGDLLGVKISTIIENDEELEYVLFSLPILEMGNDTI